ncbi:MAG: hypothetical protein K9H61_14055 [Bacteroidia bacterium]|nr:hypothetical protein [Bacteroidia bacterium]MCF8427899.1 hypothetical protein [Bacteroidia bacterium]MCF8448110.1 hypothetical protein [Bacteroidia bacterium]
MQLLTIIKSIFLKEGIILFMFVLTVNNYITNSDKTITADGIGYYEYLPSIFIHKDFVRKDIKLESDTSYYQRIIDLQGAYVHVDGFKINKYPIGVAILQSPFFISTWLIQETTHTPTDGYQLPYQRCLYYSGLFYLFWALVFFGKLLETYSIKTWQIAIAQLLIVFATPIAYYTCAEPSFSHVYSLFAISAFAYYSRLYFKANSKRDFLWAALFLGLILLLRQINILVLVFLPFLAETPKAFSKGISNLFTKEWLWIKAIAIVAAMLSIQAFAWYLQSGNWVLYSYREEDGFNFLKPEIANILFSYRKGLFVYTPIAFISLFGLIQLIIKKRIYEATTWLLAFMILTYVFSSWWSWYYGCSFGNRAYLEFLPFVFLLFSFLLQSASKIIRVFVLLLSISCVPLNLIQTYQYKEFILHWVDMNKDFYWKIFGETDKHYIGLVWKKSYDFNTYELVQTKTLGNKTFISQTDSIVFETSLDSSINTAAVNLIGLHFSTMQLKDNNSKIIFELLDPNTDRIYFDHYTYLNHFCDGDFNEYKEGVFNFEIPVTPLPLGTIIRIRLNTHGKTEQLDSFFITAYKAR